MQDLEVGLAAFLDDPRKFRDVFAVGQKMAQAHFLGRQALVQVRPAKVAFYEQDFCPSWAKPGPG